MTTGALLVARWLPVVLLVPVFGGLSRLPSVRLSMLFALTLLSWPTQPSVPPSLAAALAAQLLAGLAVGALVHAYAEAARTLGGLGDQALGRGSLGVADPLAGSTSGPLETLFALAWVALVCGSGAHVLLLEAIALSFDALPLAGAVPVDRATRSVVDAVAASLALATALALPLFVVTWIVDSALGWVNRALPSLSVSFLALPARLALGLLVFAALVAPAVTLTLEATMRALTAGTP